MKVKTKKLEKRRVTKLETSGELKEILIKEDFEKPENAIIALCFRGGESSGIIELNPKEVEIINKELSEKKHLLGNIKILKFRK